MSLHPLQLVAIATLALLLAGCSGDDEGKKDHVFKEKTQAIEKAREVEGILKNAAEKEKKAAESSGN